MGFVRRIYPYYSSAWSVLTTCGLNKDLHRLAGREIKTTLESILVIPDVLKGSGQAKKGIGQY
jgi:hypothetical protein